MTRVLVADDDEPIRKLVAKVLQRNGFTVVAAVDGQDAIERLSAERFDVCVLDLMMPRVDGVGVLKYMAEHDPGMVARTVVVTAYPRTAQVSDLSAVCDVVSKPFEVERLITAVRACTEAQEHDVPSGEVPPPDVPPVDVPPAAVPPADVQPA